MWVNSLSRINYVDYNKLSPKGKKLFILIKKMEYALLNGKKVKGGE